MKPAFKWTLFGFLLVAAPTVLAAETIRREPIHFAKGATSASVKGTLKGDQTVDYLLQAKAGQSMTVDFKPSNASAYFNVLPPGSETALFVGSTSGNHFVGDLPADGQYTVRVYLMRNAARRNETAKYSLDFAIGGAKTTAGAATGPAAGGRFDRKLELNGIRFHVSSGNDGSQNTLKITPSGLEIDNAPIVRTVDGTVTGAEIADINADRSPELYVYVTSAGSGSYGMLVAYSANRRKSLSEIYLPSVAEDAKLGKGYMGHDEFAVVEGTFVQRFPVYREGDTNTKPTGGMRQIQYKLKPGEAGWLLKVDRVVEY
ncbi:PliI family lysozyme inhibitor of I-type lysozyme [Methylotetracoccus oryzae]|uniref:PliI family lysozyme inhibitor of I-type lysozyme n=1 Tax=Methylotetracoccus oryzae TaxID=1919059 RepID=UPI0013A59E42|nr:PliI family lysozyme inhibitor of I-type lysozyme [Methylotetracoccus oryzae]